MSRLCTAVFAGGLAAASSAAAAPSEVGQEQLWAAAQEGHRKEVRRQLDAGVDIDAANDYGATALTFAIGAGHKKVVRLLLRHGADVNVQDTFYGMQPLGWAVARADMSKKRYDILQMVLEHGVEDASTAVQYAVGAGDAKLLRLAVQAGEVPPAALRSALDEARSSAPELVAWLETRVAELPELPVFEVDAATLERYSGSYGSEQLGLTVAVSVTAEGLSLQPAEQPALALVAIGEHRFAAVGDLPVELGFEERDGVMSMLTVIQAGQEMVFSRSDMSSAPAGGAAEAEASAVTTAEISGDTPGDVPADAPAGSGDDAPRYYERSAPANWPSFRGAGAAGLADGQGAPLRWDVEQSLNVRWQVPIPGLGLSSPIIWGDHVFLTSAESSAHNDTFRTGLYGDVDPVEDDSEHVWKIYALDRRDGSLLWSRVAAQSRPRVQRHTKSSHANPSPATDGEHVVAMLGSQGLYCWSLEGELLWQRDLGVLRSGWFYDPTFEWGFSSSPILYRGRVLVQVDIQKDSFLAAFDVETGEQLWRTERDEIPTWGTPTILLGADGEGPAEVVTNGTTVRGYDFETGQLLWSLGPNSEVTVATPLAAGGLAYVTANYPPVRPIYVVRHGARGDLSLPAGETSSDSVAWSINRGGTYIPTPILYQGILYALQMNGRLTAYDAATGAVLYRQRIGRAEGFSASAVAADGRLYFTNEAGSTYVVQAGPEFELLATNEVGEVVMATPAISDGVLVLRGLRHVFGLAEGTTGYGSFEGSP